METETTVLKDWRVLLIGVLVVVGLLIRVLQFNDQLILDDEWHSIHQLLQGKSPAELFVTFGHADYSIPLGLLYWTIAHSVGLSEQLMKLPMLVSGVLTLLLFAVWATHSFGNRVGIVFTALLAISPMLVIYSSTARPYAIVLLLGFCALYCFEQWRGSDRRPVISAAGFVALGAMSIWLHPVTGPFVVAPLVYYGIQSLARREWSEFMGIAAVGLVFGIAVSALVLPPLIADFGSLAAKAGSAELSFSTFVGVWHFWLGTMSLYPTLGLLVFALLGLPTLLSKSPLFRVACLGLALTLVAIVATQPAWAEWPLTIGRYMLPALPLLLLSTAVGVDNVFRFVSRYGKLPASVLSAALVGLFVALVPHTAILELTRNPNGQISSSIFPFHLMHVENPIVQYQEDHLNESAFWFDIAATSNDDLAVAVGPFFFETYNWGAVRWEKASGRLVKPLMLGEFCADRPFGEVPKSEEFRFANVIHAQDLEKGRSTGLSWVILTKPFVGFENGDPQANIGEGFFVACRDRLSSVLGEPVFEDHALIAYKVVSGTPKGDTSGS